MILLTEVLTIDIVNQDNSTRNDGEQGFNDVQQVLLDNFVDIKQRNEAMLFRNMPPLALAKLGSTVMDIQVLIFSAKMDGSSATLSKNCTDFISVELDIEFRS